MQNLSQFYEFMDSIQTVRRMITGYYLIQAHHERHVESLENALSAMDNLPGDSLDKRLDAAGRTVTVTIDYERRELEKDVYFLTHSDEEFLDYLSRMHDGFAEEVAQTVEFLEAHEIRTFVSDRDGTVNNYCGRYRSSHQSVWNAVYLTEFVRAIPAAPVLLTSAPLFEKGLLAMSAMPEHSTHYGGSSGREFCDREGNRGALELSDDQASALKELNARIDGLLATPEFATFALIGSGLQHKYGQTTVARQDIHGSIPDELSDEFLETIRSTVRDVDPEEAVFGIEDTGKDVEIMLTVEDGRRFSKGDGLAFLNDALGLGLSDSPCLICGDTSSDVPMVEKAVELGGSELTAAVFVTSDDDLRRRVAAVLDRSHFVSTPDALVAALHRLALDRGTSEG